MAEIELESLDELEDLIGEMGYLIQDGSFAPAFELIMADLENQTDRMFQAGKDASGRAWAPLKERTIRKKGHGIILIEYEDLYRSLVGATEDSVREIWDDMLLYGTRDRKAAYHQYGTKWMPARPPVGISDETLDRATEHVADRMVELAMGAFQ